MARMKSKKASRPARCPGELSWTWRRREGAEGGQRAGRCRARQRLCRGAEMDVEADDNMGEGKRGLINSGDVRMATTGVRV